MRPPGAAVQPARCADVAEINELKRLIQQDRATSPRSCAWASALRRADVAGGRGYYEKAIEVEPSDPDLLTDLGTAYRGMDVRTRRSRPSPGPRSRSRALPVAVQHGDRGRLRPGNSSAPSRRCAARGLNPPPPRLDDCGTPWSRRRPSRSGGAARDPTLMVLVRWPCRVFGGSASYRRAHRAPAARNGARELGPMSATGLQHLPAVPLAHPARRRRGAPLLLEAAGPSSPEVEIRPARHDPEAPPRSGGLPPPGETYISPSARRAGLDAGQPMHKTSRSNTCTSSFASTCKASTTPRSKRCASS